jgi:hypothetical protein
MVAFKLPWDPFDPRNPGPCIKFSVARYADDIEYGQSIGLEFPKPPMPTALIDTGSPFTIISKVLAKTCNLILTDPSFPIRTMNGDCNCEVYGGSMSFPEAGLPRIHAARILAREFYKESSYAGIIGRDILKHWKITFDGRAKSVTIVG